MLVIYYVLVRADFCRVNISNAAILGLKEDLAIETGTKYNAALTIFFVPYIIFEVPIYSLFVLNGIQLGCANGCRSHRTC